MKYFATYSFVFIASLQVRAQIPLGPVDVVVDSTPPYVVLLPESDSAVAIGTRVENPSPFWPGIWPWYSDTSIHVTPIGTYTVIVTEPNSCVDSSLLHIEWIEGPKTYPFSVIVAYDPWVIGGSWQLEVVEEAQQPWRRIDLFDTTTDFKATNTIRQTHTGVTSVPPPTHPETPNPASLPAQSWYEAILPQPTRISSSRK